MAFIRCGGGGIPAALKTDMDSVFNKKFGTSATYPPNDWADTVNLMGVLPIRSASGAIANFNDGADTVPLKSLTYRFTPTQRGTGDPSPSNPRAINAVTTANVVHTGANFVDSSKVSITTNRNDLSSDKAVLIKAGITYTASISNVTNASSWRFCFRVYDAAGNLITNAKSNGYISSTALADTYDTNKTLMQGSNSTATNIQFECLKDCYIAAGLSSGDVSASTTADYQLEVGSTPTAYEPFTSTAHPVDFGTVYGGEGNEVGEFTNEFGIVLDLSALSWTYQSANNRFVSTSLASLVKAPPNNSTVVENALCEIYKVDISNNTASSAYDNIIAVSSAGDLQIRDTSLNGDLDALATRLNGIKFVYPLATPNTLSVDPVAISSRLGVNNIYLDLAGSECDVEYRADIDLLVSSLNGNRGLMVATPSEPENEENEIEEENER